MAQTPAVRPNPLVVFLLCLALPCARAAAQAAPIAVTTDSLSYCDNLARRVLPVSVSAEGARLAHEGAALCEHGHLRGGIMRLRRALVLAREDHAPAPGGGNAAASHRGDAWAPRRGDALAPRRGDALAPRRGDASAPHRGDARTP